MSAEEQQHLLPKTAEDAGKLAPKKTFVENIAALKLFNKTDPSFIYDPQGKLVTYNHNDLLTVKAFMNLGSSVLGHWPIWYCLAYVTVVSFSCATGMYFLPNAKSFDTAKFGLFCTFLKVFISFMVGLYVRDSFMRWWNTVICFEDFLIAIKQLMFFMHSINISEEAMGLVQRYCIASAFILTTELAAAQHVSVEVEVASARGSGGTARVSGIATIRREIDLGDQTRLSDTLDQLIARNFLEEGEKQLLLMQSQSGHLQVCRCVWSWIAEILSVLTKADGSALVPPMFIRVLTLAQGCILKIEHLKRNVTVQTPFAYAHLLAMLVHVYITLLAVFGGLTLGSAFNEVVHRSDELLESNRPPGHLMRDFYGAMQMVSGQLVIMMVEPILYIGFLHIAHVVSYPFGNRGYNLPTETYIERLHIELNNMADSRSFCRTNLMKS